MDAYAAGLVDECNDWKLDARSGAAEHASCGMVSSMTTIDLALQGGGAHGAFTWGVLDRLLEDDRLEFDGISGTSAGAMNAVVLATASPRRRQGARDRALHRFWRDVSAAARFSPLQRHPLEQPWAVDATPLVPGFRWHATSCRLTSSTRWTSTHCATCSSAASTSTACAPRRAELFISATNVRTGRPRIFRRAEIDIDHVMASACLPQLFRAVEIEGEAYWDGGYWATRRSAPDRRDHCA